MPSVCGICVRGQLYIRHIHESSLEHEKKLLERGRRHYFCLSCSQGHVIPNGGLGGEVRILITSSTLALWDRSGHPSSRVEAYQHWHSLRIRGANLPALLYSAITELEKIDLPLKIIVAGGIFNAVDQRTPTVQMKMAIMAFNGFLRIHDTRWGHQMESRVLFAPSFFPPIYMADERQKRKIVDYNHMCTEVNSLNGFTDVPTTSGIDKLEGHSRGASIYRGVHYHPDAYREYPISKGKHLTPPFQFRLVCQLLDYFCSELADLD